MVHYADTPANMDVDTFMVHYAINRDVLFSDFCAFFQSRYKLNKSEMAKKLGVPLTTYSAWSRGIALPVKSRVDVFKRICPKLNTELLESLIDEER